MKEPVLILKPSADTITVGAFQRAVADDQIKLVLICPKPGATDFYALIVSQDDWVRELWTENRTIKQEPSIDGFVSFLVDQCSYRGDVVIRGSSSRFAIGRVENT